MSQIKMIIVRNPGTWSGLFFGGKVGGYFAGKLFGAKLGAVLEVPWDSYWVVLSAIMVLIIFYQTIVLTRVKAKKMNSELLPYMYN